MIFKRDLEKVILKQQNDLARDLGIAREKQLKILPKFATIISGVRRCGKSTLARQYLKSTSPLYYLNFEDINLSNFELSDFSKLDELFPKILGNNGCFFFDEIQIVPEWERYIRQLTDRGDRAVITGSNAAMLSKELGTRLTGRQLSTELYPFSYMEFLLLRKMGNSPESFSKYLEKGGFPEYLKTDDPEILSNLFQDIFYRDIMHRNELRSESAVKNLLHYAISNIGKVTSYNNLKNLIGVGSVNSVSQFINHFELAYVLFEHRKFDYSLRKQMVNPKKLYCVDNGLIAQNAFTFSENKGRMLENTVFLHLKRSGHKIFYHKDKQECDFLVYKGSKITDAIQVCFELHDENQEREIKGIEEAMHIHSLNQGTIVTFNEEDVIHSGNKTIKIVPAWKWMAFEPG
jgi:predicted AAA+ superfamily ATPase